MRNIRIVEDLHDITVGEWVADDRPYLFVPHLRKHGLAFGTNAITGKLAIVMKREGEEPRLISESRSACHYVSCDETGELCLLWAEGAFGQPMLYEHRNV